MPNLPTFNLPDSDHVLPLAMAAGPWLVCYTQPVNAIKLAPSILAADFTRLGEQVKAAEEGGADYIHIDVMDGQFVPNITVGPLIVQACKRATRLPLDVHLMIVQPERFLEAFATAGADILTIHAEATAHVHRALELIRQSGARVGLAVNPLTPLTIYQEALPYLDQALIMSVNPGFGGQEFIASSLHRLLTVSDWREELNPHCEISVDGGIDHQTAPRVVEAGADVLVAGSAIFNGLEPVATNIAAMHQSIAGAETEG